MDVYHIFLYQKYLHKENFKIINFKLEKFITFFQHANGVPR